MIQLTAHSGKFAATLGPHGQKHGLLSSIGALLLRLQQGSIIRLLNQC